MNCSLPLVTPRVNRRRHGKRAIYAKLPDDVKAARFSSKNAFDSWKRDEFSNSGAVHDIIARSVGTTGNFYANF